MRAQNEMRNVSGNWRKADPLLVAVSLVEVCPAVMWKSEYVSDELEYLGEEIFQAKCQKYRKTCIFIWGKC